MLLMGLEGCGGVGRRERGDEGQVWREDRFMVWLVV